MGTGRYSLCPTTRARQAILKNWRNSMFTKTNIAAVAITVLIIPAPTYAQALLNGHHQAVSGAYAAATKSSRATLPAQRGGAPAASAQRVFSPEGRLVGADPDAAVRFALRRDSYECRY